MVRVNRAAVHQDGPHASTLSLIEVSHLSSSDDDGHDDDTTAEAFSSNKVRLGNHDMPAFEPCLSKLPSLFSLSVFLAHYTHKIELVLDASSDDLQECIDKTLTAFATGEHTCVTASPCENTNEDDLAALPSTTTTPSQSPLRFHHGNKKNHHQRMLFDDVIAGSRGQVYDAVLGFLPKEHPIVQATLEDPQSPAAHILYGHESDFSYVQGMVKEKDAMASKLRQEAERRRYHGLTDDIDELDWIESKKKSRAEVNHTYSHSDRDYTKPCALCTRPFHPNVLLGLVPFRAIAKWRENHSAPIPANDRRLAANRIYEDAKICVFCNQVKFGLVDLRLPSPLKTYMLSVVCVCLR